MSIQNFIPMLWQQNLDNSITKRQVVGNIVNRSYVGDINQWGDQVNIISEDNDIRVKPFIPDEDEEPDMLLTINHGAYYNFFVNDADRVQTNQSLINEAIETAASRLAMDSEQYLISTIHDSAGVRMEATLPNSRDDCYELLAKVYATLKQKNRTNIMVSFIVPAYIASLMLGDQRLRVEKYSNYDQGVPGVYCFGFPIYVSEDAPTSIIAIEHNAVAFAGKVTRCLPYSPERSFCDGVKGLYLCGAKVVKPDGVCICELTRGGAEW